MRIKDIIGLAVLSLVLFPITLLGTLMATGVVRLEMGLDNDTKAEVNTYLRRYHPEQDRSEVKSMKSLAALEKKQNELREKEEDLRRENQRLENIRLENQNLKNEIVQNRLKIEKLVAESSDIKKKRLIALAEVYGSMRPEEAAPILLSLDDQMIAEIIRLIPEVRMQSKLMGAMGAMDVKRTAKISKIIGKPFEDGV